jgi:gamma-glutamylcyclotransferase (GGCT)/AIG2-like uncharacterized protein YtfP
MTSSPGSFLFVYGTLRPGCGHPMAKYLADHGQLIGAAKVAGRLYDLGPFPGLVEPVAADHWVRGEVYELSDWEHTLAEIDRYEDSVNDSPLPMLFERLAAEVTLEDGRVLWTWVYWYRGDFRAEQRIVSGDYLARAR